MRRVVWTLSSKRDLSGIRTHIAKSNPFAADRVAAKLLAAAEALCEYPDRGRRHPKGWRELTRVKPYIMQYRVTDDAIRILRIRHAARRPI